MTFRHTNTLLLSVKIAFALFSPQKVFSVKSRPASIAGSGQCPGSSLFTSFVKNARPNCRFSCKVENLRFFA
jgi:hypothetical protein